MSRSRQSSSNVRPSPFSPGNSGLQRLHDQSSMDEILPWLRFGEQLRARSPYGQYITWYDQGVVAWKDGNEQKFNRLEGRSREEPGAEPSWFPDITDRHLFKTFQQYPLRRAGSTVEGKHKMGLFICYPASPVGMQSEIFDNLWMHAWLCIIKAPDGDARQGKTVAIWDCDAQRRFGDVEKRKTRDYESATAAFAESSTISERLPSRSLRSREIPAHTLVTNRPTPTRESAKRLHDVLQGRQLDVVQMYPHHEAVMLGGSGNEGKSDCLPLSMEEALAWLSGERGDLTKANLVAAGFQFLDP